MSDQKNNSQPPHRELSNVHLFADDIVFSDTEKILFGEDLKEAPVDSRHGLMDGNPAERYTIIKKLNEGGMKAIWEVDDHRTARKVAMALIQDSRIASEKDIDAFLYEARLTANLQHPNIIPIYDIALDENGNPYFTMKALKGETLGQILKQKRDGKATAKYTQMHLLSIFLKVCNAINYAHAKGVLHLDLKPSNVIVGNYGDVHVLDWGLSTLVTHLSDEVSDEILWQSPDELALESGQTLTRYLETSSSDRKKRNVIGGTPGYMAPEQAKASPADIDFRTDVFMLGAMLYEILTLHHAVEGATSEEVLKKTVRGDIIPPNQHNKKMPTALVAITLKALSPSKNDRYPTVAALIHDVQQYQDGFATEAENPTFVTHLILLIKRHKKPVSLIALFVSLIILILLNSIHSIKASERQAIAAHNLATQSLRELKEKNEYIRDTARRVAPDYLAFFSAEEANHQFARAEKALETGLAFDPNLEQARISKAQVLLCQQRFKEAQSFLPPSHPLYQWIATLSAPITDAQLPAFITKLNALAPESLPRFFYHLNQQPSFNATSRFKAIDEAFTLLNPKMTDFHLAISASASGDWNVDLSTNPALENIVPLCGLPITKLDLSGVGAIDLTLLTEGQIRELRLANSSINHLLVTPPLRHIESLDISGTRIRNLTPLLKYANLTALDISHIDDLSISDQLLWCQRLSLLTISRQHRNHPTIQTLAKQGVILIYSDK